LEDGRKDNCSYFLGWWGVVLGMGGKSEKKSEKENNKNNIWPIVFGNGPEGAAPIVVSAIPEGRRVLPPAHHWTHFTTIGLDI